MTLLFSPCWADEVHLGNGDRLTGTIVTIEESILILGTAHGGEVKMRWPEIQRLSDDKPNRSRFSCMTRSKKRTGPSGSTHTMRPSKPDESGPMARSLSIR